MAEPDESYACTTCNRKLTVSERVNAMSPPECFACLRRAEQDGIGHAAADEARRQETREAREAAVGAPTLCCEMRKKAVLILGPILPEEVCGVPDSALADFMRFDINGPKPVLGIRFCPWCGKPLTGTSEVTITATGPGPEEG